MWKFWRQADLEKIVTDLATETRRGFDQAADQFREVKERFRETDERFRRTDEQHRATNERVDKLVSAVGELVRFHYPPRK